MNFASFLLPVVSSEGLLKKGNPGGGRGGSLSLEIPAGESSSDLGNHPLVGCTFFSGKSFI